MFPSSPETLSITHPPPSPAPGEHSSPLSTHLPILDASCRWNHTLCLASFTRRIFEVLMWVRAEDCPSTCLYAHCKHPLPCHTATPRSGRSGMHSRLAGLLWACPLFLRPCWLLQPRGPLISSYVLPGAGSQLLSDLAVPGLGVPDAYSHTDTHTRM